MQEWLLLQDGIYVYIGLFLLLMGGAIGLPIPEDIPLILAGILAHQGNGKIEILFIVCYATIILGDVLIFSVGKKFGPALFKKPWFKSRMNEERIIRIRRKLEKRSLLMIFLARHLFYLRTVTFLACGAFNMSYKRFLAADATAALVSAPLMMWLGYAGAESYHSIREEINDMNSWLILLGGLVAVFIFLYTLKRKLDQAEGNGDLENGDGMRNKNGTGPSNGNGHTDTKLISLADKETDANESNPNH